MEQPVTADSPSAVLSPPPQLSRPSSPEESSVSRLTTSEPSPPPTLLHPPNFDDLSNSVPSLRFPRPLGNRQLTNWVSSSSPDIMHPGSLPDDGASLAELGYDVIGTDGESQAESTTSSFDYQRPDDVQSLAGSDTGTDVDTNEADSDSSEDEEEIALEDTAEPTHLPVEDDKPVEHDEVDMETLANRSLENPTNFSQHGFPSFHSMAYAERLPTQEQLPTMEDSLLMQDTTVDHEEDDMSSLAKTTRSSRRQETKRQLPDEVRRLIFSYVIDSCYMFVFLSSILVLYGLATTGKSFFGSPLPRELVTVPVASVSSIMVPSPTLRTSLSSPSSVPTLATTQTHKALQTDSAANGLAFMPFGKEKAPVELINAPQQTICSVDMRSRNEILITIPPSIKSIWLARDAILVAVSRGIQDIPSKVTSVSEGFLIQVPLKEAYGVLAISLATTHKPKINETFRINFGNHMLTEAFDAGKQLVKGLAQKVVDTVNGTTTWVEETYIPALDTMSKHVCVQTASLSDTLLQGVRDAANTALAIPARLTSEILAHIKKFLSGDVVSQRTEQAHLELTRQAQDVRDELALALLKAQLGSKLLWLKMQGKMQEYERYLSKAEVYWEEKRADANVARRSRAEYVKKQIRAQQKRSGHETRGSFWNKGRGGY
ncbi:hypothetical protein F4809DRAFT_313205 [Biscogniauxia mediterranea]|nr:hypothetical protein F4809DRAFT_313205 [Biscogniauxia mediterranea]